MRVVAALVGRQLDNLAAACAALLDRPFQKALPQPFAAPVGGDADSLDLAAPGALQRQAGKVADLQRADHLAVVRHDSQKLVGIGTYRRKGIAIGFGQWLAGVLAAAAER